MNEMRRIVLLSAVFWVFLIILISASGKAVETYAIKVQYNEIILNSADGVKIAANYYTKGYKQLIIVLNDTLETKDSKFKQSFCQKLNQDFDVLNIDFRGQGRSSGEHTSGNKEIFDIKTAINFAASKGYTGIGLVGFGFGGYMAVKGSALNRQIHSLVIISAPYSINSARNKDTRHLSPNIAVKFGTFLLERLMGITNESALQDLNTLELYLDQLVQPLFVIHASKDPVVPFTDAKTIFQQAAEPKTFMSLDGECHAESLCEKHAKDVLEKCILWFEVTLP